MIRFLASIFRGLSYVIGITAPPPGQNERLFVSWWLGGIVFTLAAFVVIFYVLSRLGAP
jgi:hypothetical protein